MAEKMMDKSCTEFAAELAGKVSVPGGGGAAAYAGALGVALCSMVGNFTTGKKKYAEYEEDIQRILREGEVLRTRLLDLVAADAQAFEPLSRAYSFPKDDPRRADILEEVTLAACSVPLEILRCCGQVLPLLEALLEKGSRLLISDVGCGALLCKAAMECAAMNLFVNTAALRSRADAAALEGEADALLTLWVPRAEAVAAAVTSHIRKEH
jgi:formiminotetrahydrofolate cyclodeaminase